MLVDGETHEQIEPPLEEQRRLRGLTIQSIMVHPDEVGTDPTYAGSIIGRMVDTGALEGEKPQGIPGLTEFGPEATAVELLRHFVASSISHHLGVALEQFLEALVDHRGTLASVPARVFEGPEPDNVLYAYRARDLNGIWATAPYLHNGTVLTLWDLLSPPEERPKVIHTGTFQYDHENLGLADVNVCPSAWDVPGSAWTWPETDFGTPERYEAARERWPDLTICQAQGYELIVDPADPAWVGNHNSGHSYGTHLPEADRRALLEYLKTL